MLLSFLSKVSYQATISFIESCQFCGKIPSGHIEITSQPLNPSSKNSRYVPFFNFLHGGINQLFLSVFYVNTPKKDKKSLKKYVGSKLPTFAPLRVNFWSAIIFVGPLKYFEK